MSEAEEEKKWSVPCFKQAFSGVRLQQGHDAAFVAVVSGSPCPQVTWTRKGKVLPSSDKYRLEYNADTGKVALTIIALGPGDEGQYCCKVSNDYGSATATLNVTPDINNMRHRALSPGCCRTTLQRKMQEQKDTGGMTI